MALLPKNQRDQAMTLVCIVAIALAALYWMYVYSPKHVELAAIQTRVDSLEHANARARAEVAKGTVDDLTKQAEQYAQDLEIMRKLVPTGNDLPALLEQLSTAARRAGLDVSPVEPEPVVEGEMFDTYRYKITVTGGYHALGTFLGNVGSLARIVAPVNLSLAPASNPNLAAVKLARPGTAAIDSRFEVQTYVIKSAPAARGGKS